MSCELAVFAIPKARKNAVGSWRPLAGDIPFAQGMAAANNGGDNNGEHPASKGGKRSVNKGGEHPASKHSNSQARELEVRVCAAPEKGKATKAIIKVLAAFFDVAARDVKLISGQTSRHKRFEIVVDKDHFDKCLAKIEV